VGLVAGDEIEGGGVHRKMNATADSYFTIACQKKIGSIDDQRLLVLELLEMASAISC
jgi:hypothetical protein